ncbi:MAG: DnaJ domain-containing protein [Chloroflexota bacterium]|nr:DnaJ domain-containing protein [Chloroflexota bacterium]
MPKQTFRGDPYRVLDVPHDASGASIKRRWRELAREHHPDRAAGDAVEAARLTDRMARINAAYDLLSDPLRRAQYDDSAEGRTARRSTAGAGSVDDSGVERPVGPPPPPPTRPVTARFDTSPVCRPRNSTLSGRRHHPPGHEPVGRRRSPEEPLRASTPTGPVERQPGEGPARMPSLREALATELSFGKFRGYTLGEIALIEPTYIDWLARTITRDRDLVAMARVVQADLDEQGVARRMRPSTPFYGSRASSG